MEAVLSFIWEYVIVLIVFKLIIAKGVANYLLSKFKGIIRGNDRTEAIWQHYKLRAVGEGHQADDVLDCRDQNCQVFSA